MYELQHGMSCGDLPFSKELNGKKPDALLTFLSNLKDASENCGECEDKAVWGLAYFLSDGAKYVHKASTATRMSTDAHAYHETCSVVINALIQCFLSEKMPQKLWCMPSNGRSNFIDISRMAAAKKRSQLALMKHVQRRQ